MTNYLREAKHHLNRSQGDFSSTNYADREVHRAIAAAVIALVEQQEKTNELLEEAIAVFQGYGQ